MTSQDSETRQSLPYLLHKNSLKLFEKPWDQLDAGERQRVRRDAEEELRLQQAILASDEAAAVVVEDEAVRQAVAVIRQRFADEEAFLSHLRDNGLDEASLWQGLAGELKVEAVCARIESEAPGPSEQEVEAFYEQEQERFALPERRTARHILITINEEFAENTPAAAYRRISRLRERLEGHPEGFAELAASHSECPSALQGGQLGTVARGRLFAELEEALFSLERGGISQVVETSLGYHLVYCEEILPAGGQELAEVAPRIRALLTERKRRQARREWLKRLVGTGADAS